MVCHAEFYAAQRKSFSKKTPDVQYEHAHVMAWWCCVHQVYCDSYRKSVRE